MIFSSSKLNAALFSLIFANLSLVIAILAFVLGYLVGKHYTDKKYKTVISNTLIEEHKPNPVKFLQTFEEVLDDVEDEDIEYEKQLLNEHFSGNLDLSAGTIYRKDTI